MFIDNDNRGMLLIGAFLIVAFFAYAMMEATPYLSTQKKRRAEEDLKYNLQNIRRALRQYSSRYGDITFIDPETGMKTTLDYQTDSKKIYYVMNALLREGRISYNADGKLSFKGGGRLRQGYTSKYLNKDNLQITRNLIPNSSFENVYIDEDNKKILVDGWDNNDGYGKAYIMTGESPYAGKAAAYKEGDEFGLKTVVIEKYR